MRHELDLKVCGMRDAENIRQVGALAPDFMGFIFYNGSPRYVGPDFAIPDSLPARIKRVGVFVNESTDEIIATVKKHRLDFVQLHGHESADQCRRLKATGVGVIKVFSVGDDTRFTETAEYREVVDYFLFDTKGKYFGGNARRFDWQLLTRYDQQVPFFLSGGISPENIAEVLSLGDLNIAAVDVNSGVELKPAWKDVEKIRNIRKILQHKL